MQQLLHCEETGNAITKKYVPLAATALAFNAEYIFDNFFLYLYHRLTDRDIPSGLHLRLV